jgi:uncharacterized protein HemX
MTTNSFALPSLPSFSGIGSGIGAFFGGGWFLYALIFAAGLGAGGYATHLYYQPKLANEQVATANAKAATAAETSRYDGLAAASQKAVADALKQVSDENIAAAQQSRKDATTISGLQAELAQEQIAHVQISAKLSAELERAKGMGNQLSPAVMAYLDELRKYGVGR